MLHWLFENPSNMTHLIAYLLGAAMGFGGNWRLLDRWGALFSPLLAPWASLALMVAGGYFFYAMATAGLMSLKAFGAMGMMFVIGGGAEIAKIALTFGKSCG